MRLNGQRLNQEVTGTETLNRQQGPVTGELLFNFSFEK